MRPKRFDLRKCGRCQDDAGFDTCLYVYDCLVIFHTASHIAPCRLPQTKTNDPNRLPLSSLESTPCRKPRPSLRVYVSQIPSSLAGTDGGGNPRRRGESRGLLARLLAPAAALRGRRGLRSVWPWRTQGFGLATELSSDRRYTGFIFNHIMNTIT